MDIKGFIGLIEGRDELGEVCWNQRIRAHSATYAELTPPLPQALSAVLKKKYSIDKLYSHQTRAIEIVRSGRNVVVMTPTASGKSLIYNLPFLERLLIAQECSEKEHALYIFPLKGLTQDQLKTLTALGKSLKLENLAAVYDGDTTSYKRRKIRQDPPNVLLTNPDMLHMGLLAHHENWEGFFRGLKYVVIDELHTYRGVFGSHVSNVLRRLRRIARHYGADPIFISCSATIANPKEVASMLTGLDFELVKESGAPIGERNFIFLDPAESPYTSSLKLFIDSINSGFKCITFTKARKITELIYRWAMNQAPEISERISSYRAGFLPEERRAIEQRLFSGELDGVISTSALELGVDIGGLDVCILVGYPGTISSTWQRAGRVGRSGKSSLIIMVAIEDALDKYFLRNPEAFFSANAEAAVLDTDNFPIKKAHLLCAAHELQIKEDEVEFDMPSSVTALKELEEEGKLRHWERGNIWYPRGKTRAPHRSVSLRSS
ncbi:MAG: DEAD/DEAH box helicase, partial [Proteobacteria bacterium]|nr:DEAD/DEAH box helicase [Pseudomonadota bacterium]